MLGTRKPRLLVADDNPLILDQVVLMLGHDFDVVARVGNGADAVEFALRLMPDVLILDISMPVMGGLRAAEQLRDRACRAAIVFLTVHDDEEFLRAARAVGGLGYVLKSQMRADLVEAVRAALDGRPFVSAELCHQTG